MTNYSNPKNAFQRNEAERLKDKIFNKTNIENGILRWNSNDQVPPTDVLAFADFLGVAFDLDLSIETKETEQMNFLDDYINARATRSKEQIREEQAEMRAAFGTGETVVNVITGERIVLK